MFPQLLMISIHFWWSDDTIQNSEQDPVKCHGISNAIMVTRCPFYSHGLTLNSAWISNYTHYKLWDEIIYPFLNFNGATVEV